MPFTTRPGLIFAAMALMMAAVFLLIAFSLTASFSAGVIGFSALAHNLAWSFALCLMGIPALTIAFVSAIYLSPAASRF